MAYVSAGNGIESEVVPNRASVYTNPGVVLPALLRIQPWLTPLAAACLAISLSHRLLVGLSTGYSL